MWLRTSSMKDFFTHTARDWCIKKDKWKATNWVCSNNHSSVILFLFHVIFCSCRSRGKSVVTQKTIFYFSSNSPRSKSEQISHSRSSQIHKYTFIAAENNIQPQAVAGAKVSKHLKVAHNKYIFPAIHASSPFWFFFPSISFGWKVWPGHFPLLTLSFLSTKVLW